jgi:signal transduction histidine kinase
LKHTISILLALYLYPFTYILMAQEPYFQEETTSSPESEIKHVTGIATDRNNCIWFASQTGIYRYDGARFRHYSVLNTPALKFERMAGITLLNNKAGSRWCFRDSKGNPYEVDSLSRIQAFISHSHDSDYIVYNKFYFDLPAYSQNSINQSFRDSVLELHTIPDTKQVFIIHTNGSIVSMKTGDLLKGSMGSIIYRFNYNYENKAITTNKKFYVISPGGLLCWENPSSQLHPVVLKGDILKKAGKGIDYNSVFIFRTGKQDIILLWYDGNTYETTESGNSYSMDTRLLVSDPVKEAPVSVFYSSDQQLFISYFLNKGLVFYRPRQFSLFAWRQNKNALHAVDYYYSMIPDNNGFITMNDEGIIWLGMNGDKRMLSNDPCFKYFLFKDRQGNIWYESKKDHFINYLQPLTGRKIPVMDAGDDNGIAGMYQPDDTTYYITTNRLFRKIIIRNKTLVSTQLLQTAPPGTEFNVLYPAAPGSLWLGTDRGLMIFTIADQRIKNVPELDKTYIRSVAKLGEANYLVGTYDKGIYQYIDHRWIHFASSERKMPASAHAFIIDKLTSSVWVSSNEGILRIPLQQLLQHKRGETKNIIFRHFTSFGPDIPSEFNGSSNLSGASLADTCLAFANAKGLVVFDPRKLISYPLPHTVLAEPVNEYAYDTLPVNKKNRYQIEFNPVVPYFGDRSDLEITYHLTNSDEGWHSLSPNSIISYNNLSPGSHDLQFRIRHHDDLKGKEAFITAKSFSIPYRWYQQTWFAIVSVLGISLLIVFMHYLRVWYILKREKELGQLVKMKTSELLESNENLVNVIQELSLSEANLKQSNFLKDEYYAVLTHDLRSPLKFLSFNINQLLGLLPELSNEALKKGLYAAHQCSNDVYKLIDEFVYWIQDNEQQLQAQPVPTLVSAVVEDAKKIYGFSIEGSHNTLITDIPPDLLFMTDPKLLFIVLRNAIDNANKYTSNGTITVSAVQENDYLKVIVTDTGRGMNADMIKDLVDLQNLENHLSYKQRKSLGFYIMAMLTKKLGGSYTIESEKGKGTRVSFVMPGLKTSNI